MKNRSLTHSFLNSLIAVAIALGFVAIPAFGQESKNQDSKKEIYNTEKKTEGFLSPEKSLEALQLPDGFQATLFSAEPDVMQPIAGTTDSRGRLWICENYTYSESKVNFDIKLDDRIVIFEDTNQDGKADSRKVFWDKAKRLTSVAIGFDGVYAACAPQLLFIPDRNHDDVPDGPPEVLLDGWNDDAVRHNIVNGLMWGPDGWLYGRHGIMATSFVGPPGASRSQRTAINCGIWRYHPIHKKFEVVCHGTTNPWGMDFNNEGEMFMINTVIGHLWHVVPGARYDRMYGSHFNPYTYQTIKQTADHYHWNKSGGENWHDTKKIGVTKETDEFGGGHAHCGLMFYGDDHWPQKYQNTLLTCNLHGLRINCDRLERKGNGYVGKHNPDFAKSSDQWFRGIELVRSHDKGFYLLDWQDTGECHENDGVHRTSGRIYKVTYGDKHERCPDLTRLSHKELLANFQKANRWLFQQSAFELRRRISKSNAAKDEVLKLVGQQKADSHQLSMFRVMLASDIGADELYRQVVFVNSNGKPIADLLLSRTVMMEIIRVYGNELALERETSNKIKLLVDISSRSTPRMRQLVASILFRLEPMTRLRLAQHLVKFGEDQHDNMQPLLIWYAIEPLVVSHSSIAAELAKTSKIPLVSELIARRLTEEIDNEKIAAEVLKLLSKSIGSVRHEVLHGIAAALNGRRKVNKPAGWDQVIQTLKKDTETQKLAQQISLVFGDGQALDAIRRVADDKNSDPRSRGQAFLTLAENRYDGLLNLLNKHLGDRDVRQYVIEAYAYCDHTMVATKIIGQFKKLKPAGKAAAINTLTKRAKWAKLLLDAVKKNQIDRSYVTAWHARQIDNMGDAELSAMLVNVWGPVRKTNAEKVKAIESLKKVVGDEAATESQIALGKKLFEKSCANCHVLFGRGGKVGPDLTGSNRKDLGYLLENIIDPSSSVADSFRSSIVELVDGRTVTGVILKDTKTTLEIQTAEKQMVIDQNDVERVKKTTNSLMPENLLNDFSDAQKKALFRYLMSD